MKYFLLAFISIAAGACGGITGELSNNTGVNRSVDLSGAVFAWVDQSDADLVSWESPRLALAFTGLSVSPEDDLLELSGSNLADLQLRFATGDILAILVPDAARQSGSATLEAELVPGAFRCPPLNQPLINSQPLACYSAAPETLDSSAGFDGFAPIGRKAKLVVELDEGGRTTGESISGNVTLTIERLDSDSEQAVTGSITGSFSVTLLGERLAERNLLMLTGSSP